MGIPLSIAHTTHALRGRLNIAMMTMEGNDRKKGFLLDKTYVVRMCLWPFQREMIKIRKCIRFIF